MFDDSDLLEDHKMIDHHSNVKVNLDDPKKKYTVEDENILDISLDERLNN